MTTIATGNRRLLRLAKILDTADALHKRRKEPAYDQTVTVSNCGTPGCALGHYAFNTPERFRVNKRAGVITMKPHSVWIADIAAEEFGLSKDDGYDLFGQFGCNNAKTAKAAARYIRAFVKRRTPRAIKPRSRVGR